MKKVPASDTTRKDLQAMLSGDLDTSEFLKTSVRLMIEEALEAEFEEALGRGRYERNGTIESYRNGNRIGRFKTARALSNMRCRR